MPRLAFVFPGQGAQYPGMGRELAKNFEEAAHVFAEADDMAGYKLSTMCFEGPAELLNQTQYAQPALLTTSLAIFRVLVAHGLSPLMFAGLSLGEYTALVAAGSLTFQEALPLVQVRGKLMQDAIPPGKGAMAAVMGLDNDTISDVCQQTEGIVVIANYNCPGQVVISGEQDAVRDAGAVLKKAGGRVMLLAVSVPSHSPLMYDAGQKLKPHLARVQWKEPIIEVVSNVNAQVNPASQLEDLLVKQLFSPVLWEQSIRYIMEKVDYFIEIGPGSTLSGLIKRIDRTRIIGQIENMASLEKVIEKVNLL